MNGMVNGENGLGIPPDAALLRAFLGGGRFAGQIECLAQVGSTNDYLKERVQTLPDGAVALTGDQTGGRGRRGNEWVSKPGAGLALSFLLKPADPRTASAVALLCGLAAVQALRSLCSADFCVKWPNDVVCGGKKVCGILCESRVAARESAVICGIGVNLSQDEAFFAQNGLAHAVSLRMLTGTAPSLEETAAAVLRQFDARYAAFQASGVSSFLKDYEAVCGTVGAQVRASGGGAEVCGFCEKLNPDGSLYVRDAAGNAHTVLAGDVSVRGVMGYV